jgi:hypothetical protein
MSILLGIAALFGIMFAMFSGAAGHELSAGRRPQLKLRSRPDPAQPQVKMQLLLEGSGFEPDSQLRFVAWHLPDGHGFHHRDPVESARPYAYRSSSFDEVAFEPSIPLTTFTGEGQPHDIKIIATDDRGNAAEAWISGKDFYLATESQVAA